MYRNLEMLTMCDLRKSKMCAQSEDHWFARGKYANLYILDPCSRAIGIHTLTSSLCCALFRDPSAPGNDPAKSRCYCSILG